MTIFDVLHGTVPVPECRGATAARTVQLTGYAQHFSRDKHASLPRNREQIVKAAERARAAAREACPSAEDFIAQLDRAGVDRAVVSGSEDPFAVADVDVAQRVAEFCATQPERFIGMCWVDPFDGNAAKRVDELVREYGMGVVGVGHTSLVRGLVASDLKLGPIFERCQALGVPVSVGSAINWYTKVPYDLFHPRHIDSVASAYPDLKIIGAHAGWPWVMDMVMVAWRHRNVYVDISTHRAKNFVNPAYGWGPLLHFGDRAVSHKVLFGSSSGLAGAPLPELLQEVRDLPLREETIEGWLGLNAERLFSSTPS